MPGFAVTWWRASFARTPLPFGRPRRVPSAAGRRGAAAAGSRLVRLRGAGGGPRRLASHAVERRDGRPEPRVLVHERLELLQASTDLVPFLIQEVSHNVLPPLAVNTRFTA